MPYRNLLFLNEIRVSARFLFDPTSICIALIGLVLIGTITPVQSQKPDVSDSTIVLSAQAALGEVATDSGPGVAVLIARGEKVIYRSARGQANIELGVPLSADQVFRIASITKMFTAALVVKMAEAGELSLDDRLARFIPDFPEGETIKLRQLLNHTAGISDRPVPIIPGFSRRDVDTAALVGEIAKRPPDFAPGTKQSYSNAGYILLGAVIEKVTGKAWHIALQERILGPLGLKKTTYGIAATVLPGRVAGYTTDNERRTVNAPFLSMTAPGAAGALVSTVDDLHLWMRAFVNGKVVGLDGFRLMSTPATVPESHPANSYGFGIYVWRVRGETMIGHTGQVPGFASVAVYLPSRDITIIALGNNDNFDAQTFGRRLASITLGNPYLAVKSIPVSSSDLIAIPGQYRDGMGIRTISARDGRLYSQRPGRNPSPLQMTANGEMYFVPDELSYMVAVRDSSGKVIRLDYFERGDGPPKPLLRLGTQSAN